MRGGRLGAELGVGRGSLGPEAGKGCRVAVALLLDHLGVVRDRGDLQLQVRNVGSDPADRICLGLGTLSLRKRLLKTRYDLAHRSELFLQLLLHLEHHDIDLFQELRVKVENCLRDVVLQAYDHLVVLGLEEFNSCSGLRGPGRVHVQ